MSPSAHSKIQRAESIVVRARQISQQEGLKRIAVAVAENREVIEAVEHGRKEGICQGIFIGNADKIRSIFEALGVDESQHEIIDIAEEEEAVYLAVKLGAQGKADVIMKGIVSTALVLKTVLREEFCLKTSPVLSHVAVLDVPQYHKLLAITDGGMVVKPDLKQKMQIIKNAVSVMQSLEVPKPKVAILAANDLVNLAMPVTTDAAILAKMSERDQLENAVVDGPLTLDMAISAVPLDYLNIRSMVAGDADILLVANLETGNMLIKTLDLFAGAAFGGLIVGSKVPLSLVSRSDSSANKLISLALSVVYSHHMKVVHGNG